MIKMKVVNVMMKMKVVNVMTDNYQGLRSTGRC